jgi:hypothetical protein
LSEVEIPNGWTPRPHQLNVWRYLMGGGLRAASVWHRRAGKDSTFLNATCVLAHQRIGTYWHMLPEKEQARKAIWLAIDGEQRRVIDQVFPKELRKKTIDDEMRIEFKNGSMWHVVGSDNYNSLVGTNPIGVVFSEYSVGNPSGWDYIRPILAENGGWAGFPYTPRGKNHGHALFRMAEKNPDWFAELLTVNDTGIISPETIQAERDSGMDDDMIEQEYFCSFEGVRQGSIYGQAMAKMRADGRIASFPYDRRYPVQTFWDIGHSDATAILCHQEVNGWDRIIAAYENSGQDMAHYVQWLKETGFLFGEHYLPHDAKNVVVQSKGNPLGANIWDQCFGLGLRDLKLVPRTQDRWTAINATRLRLDTLQIDSGCEGFISALESYHKKWDDERKCYKSDPVHDWSSNYADAIRQWAQGYHGQRTGMRFTAPAMISTGAGRVPVPQRVQTVGNRRVGY